MPYTRPVDGRQGATGVKSIAGFALLPLISVCDIPGKGRGLRANRKLREGQVITSFKATNVVGDWGEWLTIAAITGWPPEIAYWCRFHQMGFYNNSFPRGPLTAGATRPLFWYLNHSMDANVYVRLSLKGDGTRHVQFVANCDIRPGTELCTCYDEPDPAWDHSEPK